MKKTLVFTEVISKQNEKMQLQFRLPKNTKNICGIRVTTTGFPKVPSTNEEIGWLWLRVADKQNEFFAQIVRTPNQNYGKESFASLPHFTFGTGQAWIDGTKDEEFSIDVQSDCPMVEGFYIDKLQSDFTRSYLIRIYITIQS